MCDEQRKLHTTAAGALGAGVNTIAPGPAYGGEANQASVDRADGPVEDYARTKRLPLRARLVRERNELAERLSRVQAAIRELDGNPEFEKHQTTRETLEAAGVYLR